jgi:histidyl-tRNA synthetase
MPAEHLNVAFVAIDKLDKVAPDDVAKELAEKGVAAEASQAMLDFRAAVAGNDSPFDAVEGRVGDDGRALLTQLRTILAITPPLPAGRIVFDPFLARGMDYYTGPVIEIVSPGVPFSLAGGGRFDGLVERLGGPNVPACGLSIGFERVYTVMEERSMFEASARAADVLVAVPSPEASAFALTLGGELRSAGLAVDVFPGFSKLGAQYELAERKGIPFAVLAEPAAPELSVRELATRQNAALARDQVPSWIRQRLGGETAPKR